MSPIFAYAAELYREMREEFELTVEAAHAAAEEGTGGAMLNKHGRAEGIDAYSLMTGPWSRVERYGSPELIEWCENQGRPSVARYEREWFTSWLGEMPEPDALQEQLDGIRAAYTPERMAIERAISAAGPPRMMNRREANETLNKVLDILRGVDRPATQAEWYEPTKWYRAVFRNGDVWCESSDFDQVRTLSEGQPVIVQRRFDRKAESEWRDI